MIGSIIGGALGAAGSIFGGIKASQAIKKVKSNIKDQLQGNKDWRDKMYYQPETERADAQRVLTITEDSIKNRNRQAAGAQAVMGGTDESVAATKAANNEALADATSRIAAAGDARKDAIESQYMARDAQLNAELNNMEINKAGAIAEAVKGVTQAGASIASAF